MKIVDPIFIGRYRVLEEVGRGGMGIVYKAEDPSLERLVAVKILPPKLLRNKEALKRFLREAKVAAKLDHPNIIPIYDIGEDNGIYYMVMEYLEGVTLREWLEARKEINIEKALHLFKQAAQALDFAHRRKVIHRDVKPDNIMILPNETAKVMDFGIAVMDDRHSVTQMGAVLGTIAYISPEQAQGKQADVRSDIYSLGIVLFECLAGMLPFQAKTPSEMLSHHLSTPSPPPSQFNPSVPKALDAMVLKTLTKNPDERYQSVAALLEDLEKIFKDRKTPEEFLDSPSPKGGFQSSGGFFPYSAVPKPVLPEEDKTEILEGLKSLLSQKAVEEKLKQSPKGEKVEEELSHDSFAKYRPIVDRIQKDLEAIRDGLPADAQDQVEVQKERIRVPCTRCNALNDPMQKYCLECGSLLASSAISSHPEAANQGIALFQSGEYDEALKSFQEILRKDSKVAEAHLYSGFCLLKTGRLREALTTFRKVLEIDPDNAAAWEGLGDSASQLSHDLEALQAYQSAVRLTPSSLLWCKLAQIQENLGHLEEASRSLSKALELEPQNVAASKKMMLLLMKLSRYDEALTMVKKQLEREPQNPEFLRLLGQIYEETSRFNQALQAYEKAISIRPEDSQTRYRLGNLLEKHDQSDLAIAHLSRAVEADPANPDMHVKLAQLYLKENKDDSALTHLEKASALNPNNIEVHKELGKLYMKKNELDHAMVQLEWTIALDPTDPDTHSRLGQIYHRKNQPDLSIRELKTAIQFDPYNPEFHENLGMVYYGEEEIENALEEMRKAVSLDPGNVDYRKALGVMYETRGKLDMARKEYQKVVEIAPYDALAQGLLGRVYFEQNLVNLAIYQYQKSLDLDPGSSLMETLLGKAYLKTGKYDEAVKSFRKALENAPKTDSPRTKQIAGKNYFYLGQALLEKGELAEAALAMQQSIQILPTFAKAYHVLGKTKLRMGEKSQAQQILLHASRLATSEEPEIFVDLAAILSQSGDQGGAISALTKAIQSTPQQAPYHGFLGDLYFAQGDLDSAFQAYQQALKWEKNKKDLYHWKLGNVLMEKRNYGEAALQFKTACDLASENWRYHQDLAKVYEVLGRIPEALEELEKARGKDPDPDALSLIQEEIKRLKS